MNIRKDIEDKIVAYDIEHDTELCRKLLLKLEEPKNSYSNGVIHGYLLALTNLNIISGTDAVDILDERRDS